jgi:hypothetical protein
MNRYISFAVVCSLFGIVACGSEDAVFGDAPPITQPTPPSHGSADIDDLLHDLDIIVDQLPDPADTLDAGTDTSDSVADSGAQDDSEAVETDAGDTDVIVATDADTQEDSATALEDSGTIVVDSGSVEPTDAGGLSDAGQTAEAGTTNAGDDGSVDNQGTDAGVPNRCVSHGYKNYGHCVAACAHKCLGSDSKSAGQDCFKPCKASCCQ